MGARGFRLRFLLLLAGVAAGGGLAFGLGLWLVLSRDPGLAPAQLLPAFLVGVLGLAGAALLAWRRIDETVARPLLALARAAETRAHAEGAAPLPGDPSGALGPVAPALAELALALDRARADRAAATAAAAAAESAQKARLEAVIQRVDEAVVVSAMSHHVQLANARAALLLGRAGTFGLGRPLDRVLTPEPLVHALERLRADPSRASTLAVCATRDGATLLECRIALVPGETPELPRGYVLTAADVTAEVEANALRDRLLAEAMEAARRSAANITALLDALAGDPEMDAAARAAFEGALRDEAARLAAATREHGARAQAAIARAWPMGEIPAADLLESAAAGLAGVAIAETDPELAVTCDSLAIARLLRHLLERLGPRPGLALAAQRREPRVLVDLAWAGAPARLPDIEAWLAERLAQLPGRPEGREILARHEADLWPDLAGPGRPCLRLALPAGGTRRPEAIPARPEFYDFDLTQPPHPAELDATPLARLSFVVFDTETTGLRPSEGDDVIQLAAVRVVNGRLLSGETFDMLVDPGRPIPPASTRIHGLTDADVAGAPRLAEVFARFHAFAEGAVLVAHNAAFDLAFLRRAETEGLRLVQPVLDTVFLSAFLFDHTGQHGLDALAERLGVAIDPARRHTALGDALATAEILVRLLPQLRARGIATLGEALAVSERMQDIRRAQARY